MIFTEFDEMSSDIFYTLCYKEHAILLIGGLWTQQQQNTTCSELPVKVLSVKLIKISD